MIYFKIIDRDHFIYINQNLEDLPIFALVFVPIFL
jgi:hypothetical protein